MDISYLKHTKLRGIKAKPSRGALDAMKILESFDAANSTQSLARISRHLKIPKATALRTLRALEEMRYVFYAPREETYALSSAVLALAQRFLSRYETVTVARPLLADLASETGETAHFGVLQDTEVVYLEIAESPQRIRAYVLRGDHVPAHCVAAGKAILAHTDPQTLEAFLASGLARMTPATITSRVSFLRDLRATQQRGYGVNVGEWMPDVTGVSAPVFGHTGIVEGAVGVAGPISRLSARKVHGVGRIVRQYADRLSAKLGTNRT